MAEKLSVKADGGKISVGVDLNQDGQDSVKVSVSLSEALDEILKRSDDTKGTKIAYKMSGSVLKITLDTDQDGQNVAEVDIDLLQCLTEGRKLIK